MWRKVHTHSISYLPFCILNYVIYNSGVWNNVITNTSYYNHCNTRSSPSLAAFSRSALFNHEPLSSLSRLSRAPLAPSLPLLFSVWLALVPLFSSPFISPLAILFGWHFTLSHACNSIRIDKFAVPNTNSKLISNGLLSIAPYLMIFPLQNDSHTRITPLE